MAFVAVDERVDCDQGAPARPASMACRPCSLSHMREAVELCVMVLNCPSSKLSSCNPQHTRFGSAAQGALWTARRAMSFTRQSHARSTGRSA
jgi:hypothetical protein